MYGFGSWAIGGLAIVLASQYVVPAEATFLYRDVSPAISTLHQVNRGEKGDRLVPAANAVGKPVVAPRRPQKILVGCDPAFSNLAAHAQLNFAARCIS
jgi:hypothetical protein